MFERGKTSAADVAALLIKPSFAYCLLKYLWFNNEGKKTKLKTINENIYILQMLLSTTQCSFFM